MVVALAVFLALGFAFYVFFAPFVGKKLYQYIVMGVYTPLIWDKMVMMFPSPDWSLVLYEEPFLGLDGSRAIE